MEIDTKITFHGNSRIFSNSTNYWLFLIIPLHRMKQYFAVNSFSIFLHFLFYISTFLIQHVQFYVSYISTFLTFLRFLHFYVSYISTFLTFLRFLHFLHFYVSYISTFITFLRFLFFISTFLFFTFPFLYFPPKNVFLQIPFWHFDELLPRQSRSKKN